MPGKKGLGIKMKRALEAIDALVGALMEFSHKYENILKSGIGTSIENRENIINLIDQASTEAYTLKNKIQKIKEMIISAKTVHNSRFARKVIINFLEEGT